VAGRHGAVPVGTLGFGDERAAARGAGPRSTQENGAMATQDRPVSWRRGGLAAVALAPLWLLAGCETIAITALGIGASAGVNHTANGVSYRTFSAPAHRVRAASLAALDRMGVKVDGVDRIEGGELIKGRYAERSIEVTLEPMSKSTTQMRASAKRNLFVYDAATAKEIVEQTARLIATPERRAAQGSAPAL
jgi:hypothetical protein